jgi:predicted DNA-binding transcriptional regulator AlpA
MNAGNDQNGTGPTQARTPLADQQGAAEPPALMSASQAAQLCGVSEETWRRWNARGKVPRGLKRGGTMVWNGAELLAWSNAGCPARRDWEAGRGASFR